MKKATHENFSQALTLREGGKTNKEIMAETGLSHSQMERAFLAADIATGKVAGGFIAQPDSQTAKAAIITRLRTEGESWGLISVRFSEPESRTRKCFTEATGVDSAGLRIGKGGRFIEDDCRFYTGSDRAQLGKELDPQEPRLNQIPDPNEDEKRTLKRKATALAKKATTKPKAEATA